jgi:hypothetical protein
MIAYRKIDFDTLAENEQAGSLASPFYMPNAFIRIGLFIFGSVCALAMLGLLFLMTGSPSTNHGFTTLVIIFGLLLFISLEVIIHQPKPFFRAGLEEALLYGAFTAFYFGSYELLAIHGPLPSGFAFFFGCALAIASIRYLDSLLATVALGFYFYALFNIVSKWGDETQYTLPMLMIVVSAMVIRGTGWALRKESWQYWDHLWIALRFTCLLTCYAGGNYFVVREMSHALFGLSLAPGQDIPGAIPFYSYTFALPLIYIGLGLIKKDRLFLRVGFLCLALAIFTYKYYHHTLPIEWGLTLGGIALISLAWLTLRIFKPLRFGITSNPEILATKAGALTMESIAVLNILPTQELPTQGPEGIQGGGGGFGGGGASGNF